MELADIRRLIDEVEALDPGCVAGGELGPCNVAIERLRNAVEARSAAFLAAFEQDGAWAVDGARSAAGWVADRTGSRSSSLRQRQRSGLAVRQLPIVEAAARSGRYSPEHLRHLAVCAARSPEAAARDEATLVELAERLRAEDFAVAARHWCALVDDETSDPTAVDPPVVDGPWELHVSELPDRVHLAGDLPLGAGRTVMAALDAGVDRLFRAARDGDQSLAGRPASALRAETLADLVGQAMRRRPGESSAPDRYRVAVVVPGQVDPDHGLDFEQAVALCDSPAYRAVLRAPAEVLEIGRLTDRWPAAIRRAVALRDQHCVFPGCDRPPSWCDVHHCQPWEKGGPTNLDNGALLCRRHHTFIHANHWQVSIPKPRGKPETRRPGGTLYSTQRWPEWSDDETGEPARERAPAEQTDVRLAT